MDSGEWNELRLSCVDLTGRMFVMISGRLEEGLGVLVGSGTEGVDGVIASSPVVEEDLSRNASPGGLFSFGMSITPCLRGLGSGSLTQEVGVLGLGVPKVNLSLGVGGRGFIPLYSVLRLKRRFLRCSTYNHNGQYQCQFEPCDEVLTACGCSQASCLRLACRWKRSWIAGGKLSTGEPGTVSLEVRLTTRRGIGM